MDRILVTGSMGLIGTALINRILELNDCGDSNYHVTVLVRNIDKAKQRFSKEIIRDDFELLVGDVTDKDVFEGKEWDYIVHAAGNAHPKAFSVNPVETMTANLIGTINLLEYSKTHDVKKMIYLSTGEIYGEASMPSEAGWDESTAGIVDSMNPRSCYPESKRAAETLCVSYFKEYGVNAVVARLGYVFGSSITDENSRADAQFLRNALAGENIVMKSKGEQLRSYCYVKDCADALMLLLNSGENGEAYNVANRDCTHTIREYAETLADVFGVKVVFDIPDEVEKSGYSTMKKEVLNPDKLYRLGWNPKYLLRRAIEDMRKQ